MRSGCCFATAELCSASRTRSKSTSRTARRAAARQARGARPAQRPRVERSVRQRLVELKALREIGLASEANVEARQREILDDV